MQAWPEVFRSAMSAATWPVPSLFGTRVQVPPGISAVVHAATPAAGATVPVGPAPGELAGDDGDGVDDAVVGVPDEPAEPVAFVESGVPGVLGDPVPDVVAVEPTEPVAAGLVLAVLAHPAVRARTAPTAPRVPATDIAEIRFMEPNLPGR
ncbi:hypothetical protein GCM10009839_91620 [Catenulispora yoronensis]|uniref:Uncharacterized protein n=1 Tax=Catenulispora yoronensis TaxID=450799 RepID=A0ABP5H6T2_9ACTN